MLKEDFKFLQFSSLEKVFLDEAPTAAELEQSSILKNERLSYQIAFIHVGEASGDANVFDFKVRIESPLADCVRLRRVGNVPVELSHYHYSCDNGCLRKRPGLYPDALFPLKRNTIEAVPQLWHSMWVTVDPKGQFPAGEYDLTLIFEHETLQITKTLRLRLINALLPEQETLVANWFHADCLASVYHTKLYSEKHWKLIDRFMKCAIDNGVNSIYTPIFSIPLDTSPGLKRPACQLIDVALEQDHYTFNFAKLRRWIAIFKKHGGHYLEISHLFSQWGAKFAPRVVATVDGKRKELFGWHTANTAPAYKAFLDQCLPALIQVLEEEQITDRVRFHISDEPHRTKLESYKASRSVLEDALKGFPIMEACSDPEAYLSGAVDLPIVHLPKLEKWLEQGLTPFGAYFCCSTSVDDHCNRFIDMPSYRNRILGVLLYRYNLQSLLHFGFNYYFKRVKTGGTAEVVNPLFATDAGNAIQAGNGYVVYPGEDGTPIESLRLCVTFDALQDIRALKLLEQAIGHDAVVELIETCAGMVIKPNVYPKNADFLLSLRETINQKIDEIGM